MEVALGIVIGLALGAVIGWLVASARASGSGGAGQAELAAAQAAFAAAKAEAAASARREMEFRGERDSARDEVRQQSLAREASDQRAKGAEVALREGLRHAEEQQRRTDEVLANARTAMLEAFKAAGVDVLKQNAESFFAQAREQLQSQHKLSKEDLESRQKAIADSVKPLKEQLEKQEALVKSLSEKQAGDSTRMAEQVKQLVEIQGQARDAALQLANAMRDNRRRGKWGEVALRNAVEFAGMTEHVDFIEQASIDGADGSKLRPDLIVKLPGGRCIPIDCKVPLDAYLDSTAAEATDAARAAARTAHAEAVRGHMQALAKREYAQNVPGEVEYTVLYIPYESALSAAMEEDGELIDDAIGRRVLLVSGNSLIVLLRTVALYWTNEKLAQNAREIGEKGRELLERLRKYIDHMGKVGRGLGSAVDAYNNAVGSLQARVLPSANRIAELTSGEAAEAPEAIDSPRGMLPVGESTLG